MIDMAKLDAVKGKRLFGIVILIATTILWGSAFTVLKDTISKMPTFYVLALRFFPSGLIMGLVFVRQFKYVNRRVVLHGLVLGVVLFLSYSAQTLGLRYTTPARNAFITVAYCIMTPFLVWLMYKRRPHSYDVISGLVCLLGLAFISLIGQDDDGGMHLLGDGLTLVAALFFAFQLVFIERDVSQGDNPYVLLFFELTVGGLLFGVASLCYELPTMGAAVYIIPADCIWRIVYLALGCSMLAQLFQMLGQRCTTSSQAGIILSFESVFAAIFSVALGVERLTVYLVIGFALVFAAGLISQLHFDPMALVRRWRHPQAPHASGSAEEQSIDARQAEESGGSDTLASSSSDELDEP